MYWVNFTSHSLHLYGFSPECRRRWVFRLLVLLKRLWHTCRHSKRTLKDPVIQKQTRGSRQQKRKTASLLPYIIASLLLWYADSEPGVFLL